MRFSKFTFLLIVVVSLMSFCVTAKTRVNFGMYAVPPSTDSLQRAMAARSMDSILMVHPQLMQKTVVNAMEHVHVMKDKTADFYLLLFLCLVLGMIRLSDYKYFQNLWRAFWNPSQSSRQLKEQTESSSLSNFLMNIFFSMSGGAYTFYVVGLLVPHRHGTIPPSLLIIMLILGMMAIYSLKYGMVRFSGWAFKVESITRSYIFNIFLVNKIIGIALLPFVILFAFADVSFTGPLVVLSFIVIGMLLINRYTRSWQVFGSFFQYSKFHFFMYLCASELLPLAVLMKLFVQGLLYF